MVLDYSYDAVHLLNGAGGTLYPYDPRYDRFLKRLKQFPPEVLIVGKSAPFTHSLGPILSFGGENRVFPPVPRHLQEDPRRLLSPQELKYRIRAIRRFVRDVHSAGVRYLLPYLSPITMFADPQKKTGFLAFHNQWNQYASLYALGPRPPGNPLDWVQRDFNGKPSFRFAPDRPEYSPFRRYSMCINAPGWRLWMKILAQWIAKVGYDGLFMDNFLEHRCYCSYCQQRARKLGMTLSPSSPSEYVWLDSYWDLLQDLQQTFRSIQPKFYCAVNYLEIPFQRKIGDRVNLLMIERSWLGPTRYFWPWGRWPGLYPSTFVGKNPGPPSEKVPSGLIRQNIWLMRFAYALRGRKGVHFLLGAPPRAEEGFLHNKDSALLALAEGASFGGGTAVHVAGDFHGASPFLSDKALPAHQARKRFFTFIRKYPFLFKDLYPTGNVALLVFPDQGLEGLLEAEQLHQILLGRGLLIDVLNGAKVTPQRLKSYSAILVPGKPLLPRWMKHYPLLRSPNPLHRSEWVSLLKQLQKKGQEAEGGEEKVSLRSTSLSTKVLRNVPRWRVLYFPSQYRVEGCAWSNNQRFVLHLLHYQVPLGLANGGKVVPIPRLTIRLTLPEARRIERAFFYTPDSPKPLALSFQQKGRHLTLTIPKLRVYGVCELR